MPDRFANGVGDAHQSAALGEEQQRLIDDADRSQNWKRWGPYLSERQWGTVREDYSPDGSVWTSFPHEHARSRAYRWGEDGLLGITDRQCRLCFGLALWNGRDKILKERLFGLTGPEGNHGEDVKEEYFYLDSTPTHSYMKALYKYPQTEFPYADLVAQNAKRTRAEPEFELVDTGVFNEGRYFDVVAEYAKASPDDLLIRVTISNRGPERADCHVLPSVWFRNTWTWGCTHEGCWIKPHMGLGKREVGQPLRIDCDHVSLGKYSLSIDRASDGTNPSEVLFTENQTNMQRLYGSASEGPFTKDAFHVRVVDGQASAVNPKQTGTKAAPWFKLSIPAGQSVVLRMRLAPMGPSSIGQSSTGFGPRALFGPEFEQTFDARLREADEFYDYGRLADMTEDQRQVIRQAYAGLLWSKQFYHYVVNDWLDGDPAQPPPPASRAQPGKRNVDWRHLFNRDVVSMPDKWEYPWYAVWDLAFHCVAFAKIDAQFAKDQLLLILREWYMHPSGAIPAYEFAFGDVNPPVHAWACWRVYKMTGQRGSRDRAFLEKCFHKLLLNFTWWVNRKDPDGRNLFGGGFLGLDNIGVFDRGRPLPGGWTLEQADGTAWMAFYCGTMLSIAIELAQENPVYEDVASKFFEHFVAIVDAMNALGGTGLWDDVDGFYYDHARMDHHSRSIKVRSLVGAMPLIAAEVLDEAKLARLPGFKKRMDWFLEHRKDLAQHVSYMSEDACEGHKHRLLAVPSRKRLERVLHRLLDESEFLSPNGIRSLSKAHKESPFTFNVDGTDQSVAYDPGESTTAMFGGNSNWRGPVWFPINFLIVEALERYQHFYADTFKIEFPKGSGQQHTLGEVAAEVRRRLISTFLPDEAGRRPCHGDDHRFSGDPHWRELILFHEYFHGDTGRGLGASHQTGWTALVAAMLRDQTRAATDGRAAEAAAASGE